MLERQERVTAFRAGEVRIRMAEATWSAGARGVRLDLYRQAAELFAKAHHALSITACLVAAEERAVWELPALADAAGVTVREEDVEIARRVALRIASKVDLRSPREIQFARIGAALALLIVLSLLFAPLFQRMLLGRNVARGTRVTASSRYPGTPDPSGLVNGVVEATYGAHTTKEREAWFLVDFGAVHSLRHIRVIPRGDGYLNEIVPIMLETSEDGISFVTRDVRRTVFSQTSPWQIDIRVRARYMRLRTPGMGYLALAEVEAYRGLW